MTVPQDILAKLRGICLGLPETYEEPAYIGTRWRIRKKTFAHVFVIEDGQPHYYAKDIGRDGTVVTFRASPEELHALSNGGDPFFKTTWPPDMIALLIEDDADWAEVAELLTDSYRVRAPKKLVEQLGARNPSRPAD
jgi:YjbR